MKEAFIPSSLVRKYIHFILPSVFAFTLGSIYGIIDGLFVGNIVGDAGLAAISVAWPLVQLALAVGTGIGMGGSVIASIRLGEDNKQGSLTAMGTTLTMLAVFSLPLMLALLCFGTNLMQPMGASGETYVQACSYVSAVAWGIPFYVIGMGCIPLIRNRNCVKTAMAISVVAGFANVILDWLFVVVLRWGTAGAAWATVIGQGIGFLWCLLFFILPRHREVLHFLFPRLKLVLHIIKLGIAPCGLSILPEITVVVTNVNANAVGGEAAVAAYAVISYIAIIVQMMIQGVGDGTQPLISFYRGEKNYRLIKRIRRTNYAVTVTIGLIGFILMCAFRYQIPAIFGASETTIAILSLAIPLYSTSYLLYGLTHPSTSYFYAIDNSKASNAMIYGEVLLVLLVITILAHVLGLVGIWISASVIQAGLLVLALVNVRKSDAADEASA